MSFKKNIYIYMYYIKIYNKKILKRTPTIEKLNLPRYLTHMLVMSNNYSIVYLILWDNLR